MKKIVSLILVFVLTLTCLVACNKKNEDETIVDNSSTDYIAGVVDGNVYTNTTVGIKYTADEESSMSDEEEIKSLMAVTADAEMTNTYEMLIFNAQGNIIIMTEKLDNAEMTEEEYLNTIKDQLGEIEMVSAEYGDVTKTELAGIEFSTLNYPISVGVSDEMFQCVLVHKLEDRMFTITLTYMNEAAFEVLTSGFEAIA
jgi:hypothetical protein